MTLLRIFAAMFVLAAVNFNSANAQETIDLTELSSFLKKNQEQVELLQVEIETGMQNAAEAEKRYDQMIELYQNLINTVGSSSEIAEKFDAFIAQYEGYAEEAAQSPKQAVRARAEALLNIAEEARNLKIEYVKEAGKAVTIIDGLRDEKEAAVFDYRISQGQKVVATYREQLKIFTQTNERMQKALDAAREGGVPVSITPVEQ